MKITLYKNKEVECDLGEVAQLVNYLQCFFVVRFSGMLEFPGSLQDFEIDPKELAQWFRQQSKPTAGEIAILVTSSRLSSHLSVYNHDEGIALISDHLWSISNSERIFRLSRHIIQVGMASFKCHKSQVQSCVCNSGVEFDCLCEDCEARLKALNYRDGIVNLKNGFNLLNQIRFLQKFEFPEEGDKSQLRLAAAYAMEIVSEGTRSGQGGPFEGVILLIVLHFLSDLVPFIKTLRTLGCPYEDMYLIAKPYPYARRDQVAHDLEILGVHSMRATKDDPIEDCARRMLNRVAPRLESEKRKQLLVIEDGGYFAPLLHRSEFSNLLSTCIGVVEQTQKGANNDKKIGDIKLPILSVAESDFKKVYESPEIGRVAIQNIARFTPNIKLSGERAVLFGFGSVGAEVAFHLTNSFNMSVSVVDDRELPVLRARHRKQIVSEAAKTFEGLKFAKEALLVVGSTGNSTPSITEAVLKSLRDGAVLVSTSSDREEIDIKALERLAGNRKNEVAIGKEEYTIDSVGGETKKLILLAEGYPINFYASESLPNDTIDPVMTLLMLCGVEIAIRYKRGEPYPNGLRLVEVNQITEQRLLLRRLIFPEQTQRK